MRDPSGWEEALGSCFGVSWVAVLECRLMLSGLLPAPVVGMGGWQRWRGLQTRRVIRAVLPASEDSVL